MSDYFTETSDIEKEVDDNKQSSYGNEAERVAAEGRRLIEEAKAPGLTDRQRQEKILTAQGNFKMATALSQEGAKLGAPMAASKPIYRGTEEWNKLTEKDDALIPDAQRIAIDSGVGLRGPSVGPNPHQMMINKVDSSSTANVSKAQLSKDRARELEHEA